MTGTSAEKPTRPAFIKGRGATGNPRNRFEAWVREGTDDGWPSGEEPPPLRTTLSVDRAQSVLTFNQSPDVPFDRSVNPFRGCEHGCVYCFARPTHAYYGHSPGLDFESKLYWKPDGAELLAQALRKPGYRCRPIALGVNTDAWQPVERRLKSTRAILQTLLDYRHPIYIITKSALIERDMDLLSAMAEQSLVSVSFSITTLELDLARRMEPRAPTPKRRLQALENIASQGIPVGVQVAPLIPAITDPEMENILSAAHESGAGHARYILLRLPLEVKELFEDWLQAHYPDRASRVMSLIRQTHGGQAYRAEFATRMRGTGPYAELLGQRFQLACRKLGLALDSPDLDCDRFRPPAASGDQLSLF